MQIINFNKTRIYGISNSIKASSYPMSTEIDETITEKDWTRANTLAKTEMGSGHANYLKGIIIQTDITAPQYWWQQAQRYGHFDIVSSQSKMHKIIHMDLDTQCNKWVTQISINQLKLLIDMYNEDQTNENFQIVLSNCPMGLMLTARVTTNYLQLKTIYSQRSTHRTEEWKMFCTWVHSLPHSNFIIKDKN